MTPAHLQLVQVSQAGTQLVLARASATPQHQGAVQVEEDHWTGCLAVLLMGGQIPLIVSVCPSLLRALLQALLQALLISLLVSLLPGALLKLLHIQHCVFTCDCGCR